MPARRQRLPLIPYVRVSRIGGRQGERFISVEEQVSRITGWAAAEQVELTEPFQDLDRSGGNVERPEFQRALELIRSGGAGGIVVVRLDRFARSLIDAVTTVHELASLDARFASVTEKIDVGTSAGRLQFHIFAALAEFELDRITESWRAATERAVARGVHISARPPFGYDRDETGRLHPNEAAPAVRELFARRAAGASWGALCDWLETTGMRPAGADEAWRPTRQMLLGVVTNRVYLGEARFRGERRAERNARNPERRHLAEAVINRAAHEALVDPETWQLAQPSPLAAPRTGELASQALLVGLCSCASCGHRLVIGGQTRRKTGERMVVYKCGKRHADGTCPAPTAIRADKLDPWVEHSFLGLIGELPTLIPSDRGSEQARLQEEAETAERELYAYVELMQAAEVDAAVLRAGLESRQAALNEARTQLAELEDGLQLSELAAAGDLLRRWPELSVLQRRRLLASVIDEIVVSPTDGRRGWSAPPVEQRAQIRWHGDAGA